jgi:hypothetical protein
MTVQFWTLLNSSKAQLAALVPRRDMLRELLASRPATK